VSTSSQAGHTDDAGSVAEYLGGRRMCQARERKPLEEHERRRIGILGSSLLTSEGGIMLVVERNDPLELKQLRKEEDKPCPASCSRSPTTPMPGPRASPDP